MAGLLKARKASSYFSLGTLGLFAALAVVACSSDGGQASSEQTAGAPGEGNPDEGEGGAGSQQESCVGADDGQACGEASLCLDGECVPSRCGDGFVDDAAGEQCEDDNEETGDGCSLCRFDCEADAACDDGEACNGDEACDTKTHQCQPGSEAEDQTECQMADEAAGACRGGACVPPGCGNGTPDDGEDCDDANEDDADGCTSACAFTCTGDQDCDNGNACDGAEACDLETNTCTAGEALVCEAKGCTGECSPEVGECVYPDVDLDGVSCDADCDDADEKRYPGGYECADQQDNDCNPDTDDKGSPTCECYVDVDSDGFSASPSNTIVTTAACPEKYTRTRPVDDATTDCAPKVAAAYPGQKEFFPTSYCGGAICLPAQSSFDYNCDGQETSSLGDNKVASASCAGANGIVFCQTRSGWVTKVPACGEEGTYRACNWVNEACVGTDVADRPRPCR